MDGKTSWMAVWLVFALGGGAARATANGGATEAPSLSISLYNDAGISSGKLHAAEKIASSVLERAGIQLRWLECGRAEESLQEQMTCSEALVSRHLHVRVRRRSVNLNESTLGLSYLDEHGAGCQADIFYAGVVRAKEESGVNESTILGMAIAHEVGHLLLGSNSHASVGVMKASWSRSDLVASTKGELEFTAAQRLAMNKGIAGSPKTFASMNLAK